MRFEVYEDMRGEWRWRLVADNGRTVANSGEGYKNRIDALEIIHKFQNACREDKAKIVTE